MNIITINWCEEDRARIDKLIALLEDMPKHDCSKCVDAAAKYATKLTAATAASVEEPQLTIIETTQEKPAEAPWEAPEAPWETPAPAVSHADVQKKVVELSSADKKAQVREIVKAYADKVSAIPEDKLGEVFKKLTALEG